MKVPPSNQIDNVIEGEDDDDLNDEAPHSPSREGDFSVQQLEEEALMQQCIEAMQDEMNAAGNAGYQNGNGHEDILSCSLQNLSVSQSDDNSSQASKLNPDAAEFVPKFSTSATSVPTTSKED